MNADIPNEYFNERQFKMEDMAGRESPGIRTPGK